jgi:hypothetical protein
MEELKNIHEVLHDSAFEADEDPSIFEEIMIETSAEYATNKRYPKTREIFVQNFQIDLGLKQAVDELCKNNGTKMCAFLRECCRRLVSDYTQIQIGSKKWVQRYGRAIDGEKSR